MAKRITINVGNYKARGIYEAAAATVFPLPERKLSAEAPAEVRAAHVSYEMIETASRIDELAHRLHENSLSMAERFAHYAADLKRSPLHDRTSPTGYSTIHDIEQDAAKLSALREQFMRTCFVLLEKSQMETLRSTLEQLAKSTAVEATS